MAVYLLDTNHMSAALAPVSRVRERIHQSRRAGTKLGTLVPVLCELEVGIQQTSNVDACRRELDKLLKQVRIWPLEPGVARVYNTIYLDLKSRGRVLSQVDMMVAALARIMKLTVLTTDRDFNALPDIRTEDWSR